MKKIFGALAFATFLLIIFSGCTQPQENNAGLEQEWAVIKVEQSNQIWVSSEWNKPQNLGAPVNTLGWEDGAYITGDGKKLYFAYFGGDLIKYLQHGQSTDYLRGPDRGFGRDQIDVLVAEKVNDVWQQPTLDPISEAIWSEGGVMISGSDKYYMTNRETGKDQIYKNGTRLEFQDAMKDYDDPHYCANKDELYFWIMGSGSAIGNEGKIFVFKNNAVSELSSPINTDTKDYHPFLTKDCQTMYFTSNRGGKSEIYVSERLGEDSWSEPEKVVSGTLVVGEPTLTDDGRYLYFLSGYYDLELGYEADIMFTERK